MHFTQEHGLERRKLIEKRDHHFMKQYDLLAEGLAGDHPCVAAAKSAYYRAAASVRKHDAIHRPNHTEALAQERAKLAAMRMSSRE